MPLLRRRSPDPLDVARAMLALPVAVRPRLALGLLAAPDDVAAVVRARVELALAGQVREGDLLSRIPGGFLLVLPGADLWRADTVRRRLAAATEDIAELRFGFAAADPDETDVAPILARARAELDA